MELVTSWQTLMMYAKELGEAKKSGNEERIKEAQEKHDTYRDICLKSDRMELGVTIGDL